MQLQFRKSCGLPLLLGLVGATAATAFLVVLIGLHVLRPDLSVRDFISHYADGSYGALFRSSLVVHGFGNLATATGIALVFISSRSGYWGAILFGAAALGIVLGGLFSIDSVGSVQTVSGRVHTIVTFVSFPIELAAMLLLSIAFAGEPRWQRLSVITATAAAAATAALAWLLLAIISGAAAGLAERAAFAVFLPWEIIAAVVLVRNERASAKTDLWK